MKLIGSACCSHAQPRRGLRMTMAAHNEKKKKKEQHKRMNCSNLTTDYLGCVSIGVDSSGFRPDRAGRWNVGY